MDDCILERGTHVDIRICRCWVVERDIMNGNQRLVVVNIDV